MYFKSEYDAREYISKLYINSGVIDVDPITDEDGLSIIRVQ